LRAQGTVEEGDVVKQPHIVTGPQSNIYPR
jgi:hypothetical protein